MPQSKGLEGPSSKIIFVLKELSFKVALRWATAEGVAKSIKCLVGRLSGADSEDILLCLCIGRSRVFGHIWKDPSISD